MAEIRGLNKFREHFVGLKEQYVLIGGAACYLALDEAGMDFRATKDLDIVLCAEALSEEFVKSFWAFVSAGKYEVQEKATGEKQFYRFVKPKNVEYPVMLELFSREPDSLTIVDASHLTPIPMDGEISSLSAILLDENYYQCIKLGKQVIDDVSVLGAEYILPFKAKAWLDLSERKKKGERIDTKDIRKHRNDVFRLFPLLTPDEIVAIPEPIKSDFLTFVNAMEKEDGLDISNFGITQKSLGEVLESVKKIYELE